MLAPSELRLTTNNDINQPSMECLNIGISANARNLQIIHSVDEETGHAGQENAVGLRKSIAAQQSEEPNTERGNNIEQDDIQYSIHDQSPNPNGTKSEQIWPLSPINKARRQSDDRKLERLENNSESETNAHWFCSMCRIICQVYEEKTKLNLAIEELLPEDKRIKLLY